MKHCFHTSGVYSRENVSSTTMLLTDKICFDHALKTFCGETYKRGILTRAGGLENFSKTYQVGGDSN